MIRDIAPGEHYHIFNRGVGRQVVFHDNKDYLRFLFLILYFQSSEKFQNISRTIEEFVQHPMLNIAQEVIKKRAVEVVTFCIMPNHFHLIVKEVEEDGISSYMQRVLNSYSKYYNTKYEGSGHVFQGAYRSVHVENDVQLKHLSAYIHRNPREISQYKGQYESYPWSSYNDIVKSNRWGDLLMPQILLEEGPKKYGYFVQTSSAKLDEFEFVQHRMLNS